MLSSVKEKSCSWKNFPIGRSEEKTVTTVDQKTRRILLKKNSPLPGIKKQPNPKPDGFFGLYIPSVLLHVILIQYKFCTASP